MWIGPNNDQIWLPMDQTSDSVRTNSNFVCELRQIMTRYDFLLPRWMILSKVWTGSQLNLIILLVNFSCELGQIMTRYDLPYKPIYKLRYLSLDMIPHRQLVLYHVYTGNASREEFIPKECWIFNQRVNQWWAIIIHELMNIRSPH